MKLTYWYCKHLTDSDAYSIRVKTKREAKQHASDYGHDLLAPPVKVVIEYRNALDLLRQCAGEDGLYQESIATSISNGSTTS